MLLSCRALIAIQPDSGREKQADNFSRSDTEKRFLKTLFCAGKIFFRGTWPDSNQTYQYAVYKVIIHYLEATGGAWFFFTRGDVDARRKRLKEPENDLYSWYTNTYKIFFFDFLLDVIILVRIFAAWIATRSRINNCSASATEPIIPLIVAYGSVRIARSI